MLNEFQKALLTRLVTQEFKRTSILQSQETLAWLAGESEGEELSDQLQQNLSMLKNIMTNAASLEASVLFKLLQKYTKTEETNPTHIEVKMAVYDAITKLSSSSNLEMTPTDQSGRYQGAFLSISTEQYPYPQLELIFDINAPELPSTFISLSRALSELFPAHQPVDVRFAEEGLDKIVIPMVPGLKAAALVPVLSRLQLNKGHVPPEHTFVQQILIYQKRYEIDFGNAQTPFDRFQKSCAQLFEKQKGDLLQPNDALMLITTVVHEFFKDTETISQDEIKAISAFSKDQGLPDNVHACLKTVVFNKMGNYLLGKKLNILAKFFFTRSNEIEKAFTDNNSNARSNENAAAVLLGVDIRSIVKIICDNYDKLLLCTKSDSAEARELRYKIEQFETCLRRLPIKTIYAQPNLTPVELAMDEKPPAPAPKQPPGDLTEAIRQLLQQAGDPIPDNNTTPVVPVVPQALPLMFTGMGIGSAPNPSQKNLEDMKNEQMKTIMEVFGLSDRDLALTNKFEQMLVDFTGIVRAPQDGHANMDVRKGTTRYSFESTFDLRLTHKQKADFEAFYKRQFNLLIKATTQAVPVGWQQPGIFRFHFNTEVFLRYLKALKPQMQAQNATEKERPAPI